MNQHITVSFGVFSESDPSYPVESVKLQLPYDEHFSARIESLTDGICGMINDQPESVGRLLKN